MFRFPIFTLALVGCLCACTDNSSIFSSRSANTASIDEPRVAMAPDTQFAACQMITITGEDPDAPFVPGQDPETIEYRIIAEVPSNPHEMLKGLQDRTNLHPDTAMLLEFDGEHNPVLWMKDTPSSLDMAFIDAKGQVFYLEAGTEPNSTRFLTPEEPEPIATHVLQLPAGRAQDLGIFPGLTEVSFGETAPCASFRGPVVAQ